MAAIQKYIVDLDEITLSELTGTECIPAQLASGGPNTTGHINLDTIKNFTKNDEIVNLTTDGTISVLSVGKLLVYNSSASPATGIVLEIDSGLPIGTSIVALQAGTDTITVQDSSPTTDTILVHNATVSQGDYLVLKKIATTTWLGKRM